MRTVTAGGRVGTCGSCNTDKKRGAEAPRRDLYLATFFHATGAGTHADPVACTAYQPQPKPPPQVLAPLENEPPMVRVTLGLTRRW